MQCSVEQYVKQKHCVTLQLRDDDLLQLQSDDDGLQLETADLICDDAITQQLRVAGDLSAIRLVLDSSNKSLSSSHVAQTLLCMGRLGRALDYQQLQLLHQDPLMEELMEVMETNISQFTPIPLCMSLWGIAALRYNPGTVMTKIIRAVEAQMDDLEPRQLASVMWAFGRLEMHPGNLLMDAITQRATVMLTDMQPQVQASASVFKMFFLGML